jgi:Tfp pilus assembly protein FimT
MRGQPDKNHPRGSVLLFTLVVLALMVLMGAAIMANTRTELNITSDNAVGQEAFNRADSTLTIALMLTRQLSKEFTPGEIRSTLPTGGPYWVETADDNGFDKAKLREIGQETTIQSIKDRYLSATYASNPDHKTADKVNDEPFIRVYSNRVGLDGSGKKVTRKELMGTATAAVSNSNPMGSEGVGASVGESKGDPSDGANIKMYYVVTADGRASRGKQGADADQNNYYNGGRSRDGSLATHSVITTIFTDLTY